MEKYLTGNGTSKLSKSLTCKSPKLVFLIVSSAIFSSNIVSSVFMQGIGFDYLLIIIC